MKSQKIFKKRLISAAIVSVLTGLSSYASANDIALTGDININISNNGTPVFNGRASVGTNGIVGNIDGIPNSDQFFIPSFSFSLANATAVESQTPGPFTFKVGVINTNNGNVYFICWPYDIFSFFFAGCTGCSSEYQGSR